MNRLLLEEVVRQALIEDIGNGDVTSELLPDPLDLVTGKLVAKAQGVLCGIEAAAVCFQLLDPASMVEFDKTDGAALKPGERFGHIQAQAQAMLAAERVALNFLQRLSGIATTTHRLAERAQPHGIRITETRKTTPGLRMLEKYAVRIGGGYNHRMDLDHCVMLKDNHFRVAGLPPAELVVRAKSQVSHTMKVVAEAGDRSMVEPLVNAGADVVLLDNFKPKDIAWAVKLIAGRATVEVSGGINEENFEQYLIAGVDVISIGALTHSYRALDLSLEV